MKICIINSFYYPDKFGGAEESVRTLVEALTCLGHEAFVVTTGEKDSEEVIGGVKVYRVAIFNIYNLYYHGWIQKCFSFLWHAIDTFNFPTALKVGKILLRERPDLVHTNNLKGFSVAIWLVAKGIGLPVVHTLRDYYLLCPRSTMFRGGKNCKRPCLSCSVYNFNRRLLSAYVDSVVGISDFILQRHLENGFFTRANINIVFNAYMPSITELNTRNSKNDIIIGYIGRIGPYKGIELLINEFLLLKGAGTLIIAGKGEFEYEAALQEKFSSLSICFEGFLSPDDFFKRIDVLIVPSLWHEPLGRVVFEGYAYGVPVIAARRGGLPEIIENGKTGILFEPNENGSLADAIRRIMDPAFREPMRYNVLRKFEEFRPERIVASYLEIYQGMLT